MSKGPKNPERSFGVSVGIVLCVIAALLVWRGRMLRAEILGGIGVVLLVAGLLYPPILKWPSAAWWRFSRALGSRQRPDSADAPVFARPRCPSRSSGA